MLLFFRYICSVNAKDIGILYCISSILGGLIGFGYSLIIRTELLLSGKVLIDDININDLYNTCITLLGLFMIFFFVMPFLIGFLGNYFVPIQLGNIDMSLPRLNNISYWLFIFGMFLLIISATIENGPGLGWTLYVPLSTFEYSSTTGVDLLIFSLHLAGISSLISSINFIATIYNNKNKYIKFIDNSIFIWCMFITNILLLLALPILAVGITFIITDRNLNTSWYNSLNGGDPVLYQHIFWLFGLPEVNLLYLTLPSHSPLTPFTGCSFLLASKANK